MPDRPDTCARRWRQALRERDGRRWTQAEAAAAIGIGLNTLAEYERGRRMGRDESAAAPLVVRLAMSALWAGLEPWPRPEDGAEPARLPRFVGEGDR